MIGDIFESFSEFLEKKQIVNEYTDTSFNPPEISFEDMTMGKGILEGLGFDKTLKTVDKATREIKSQKGGTVSVYIHAFTSLDKPKIVYFDDLGIRIHITEYYNGKNFNVSRLIFRYENNNEKIGEVFVDTSVFFKEMRKLGF